MNPELLFNNAVNTNLSETKVILSLISMSNKKMCYFRQLNEFAKGQIVSLLAIGS